MSGGECTLASRVTCTGIGLHTGKPVDLVLRPAAAGTGVLFVRRIDGREVRFPARPEWVVSTQLATTLGAQDQTLSTVEHLLSALRGLGVDNCTVEVSGPELPIMDGSAAPFVYMIQQAGIKPQRRMRRRIAIKRTIEVRDGNRWVRVVPSRDFKLTVGVEYPHPSIGLQSIQSLRITPSVYAREIAPARTFGFLKDVQAMQANNLALGGSLQNAIVLDDETVLNREGLRFPGEFARHKALDLIGDLSLLGLPVRGHFKAMRSGHALHRALVDEIRANPNCWSVETGTAGESQPERRAPARLPLALVPARR